MRLQFILSEIGIGLRRNLPIAISVVIVTFVSLTFVGAAGLLQQQISAMKGEWYDKVEVTVYLCPQGSVQESCAGGPVTDAQRGDLEALMASPELKPYIQQVWFESQDEAYASYAKRFSDQWWFAETTAADIPASYRIKLTDPEKPQRGERPAPPTVPSPTAPAPAPRPVDVQRPAPAVAPAAPATPRSPRQQAEVPEPQRPGGPRGDDPGHLGPRGQR